ncbi:MAG: 2-C-methyl-D-erythritol 2,4-cyclodiphosphate synthase [candidate division WOR-3 bacterium]
MQKSNWRIGIGFDSHPFAKNRKLILGGVEIPFTKGLFGHSDADVLCHSIADAILGACGLKDIGNYFPNTDKKYQNISSLKILASVAKMMREKGFEIVNIDTTLILKEPKISPYVDKMKATLAKILKVNPDCIGIKAKTTEALGFVRVKSGIACYAIALLVNQ